MSQKAGQLAKTSTDVEIPGTETSLELSNLSAQIVAELAAGLSDAEAVRERYGISEAQWHLLSRNPSFRAMLAEAVQTWRGDMNAGQRITKKAEIVLEDAIPVLDTLAHNPETPAMARIEAVKQMATLAGRNAKEPATNGGTGFQININLGGDSTQRVTIDGSKLSAGDEP